MNLLHEIGPHLSGLEQLNAMLDADRRPGIGETLDIRLIEVDACGYAVLLKMTPGQSFSTLGLKVADHRA